MNVRRLYRQVVVSPAMISETAGARHPSRGRHLFAPLEDGLSPLTIVGKRGFIPPSMVDLADINAKAAALGRDVYLYNGPVRRGPVLNILDKIGEDQRSLSATLLLVTLGGDPDAAYKVARYFQEKYLDLTILVPGPCKSAGTLLALGATEIAFTSYGELGPLDIQLAKVDRFHQAESGLTITDALNTLELRAVAFYSATAQGILEANQGMVSFSSASTVAVEAMRAIYSPVMSRIDPEEIGVRARAMRIAQDYGRRLSERWGNVKSDTLRYLAETYSSHSFVIDRAEAEALFERVREATSAEKELIAALGNLARSPAGEVQFYTLHAAASAASKEGDDDEARAQGSAPGHGADPEGAGSAPVAEPAANDPQGLGAALAAARLEEAS